MEALHFGPHEQEMALHKTILLVEDDSNDAMMTQRALLKANILNKVIWVKDGEEAINFIFNRCLEEGEKLPQLILLDINMPKVTGIEVLQRIRADQRTSWLPIVIFTSSKEEKDLLESYRLGINSYICKPIKFDEFAPVVSAIGCYWLLINQGPPTLR